ncbi:stage IV sporulation protein FB [Aciduricibacillus chroicocephali]|uniref:Stage IV sporulation protein FB n=1 Tax=Aciduricibacillus chroicocephali TaxID=3054939 RepID=A0ABY9KSJ6_9BACI|nr:stage IV sporulation protein FB [Bacillaceae bacterium 44XB]
MNVLKAIPPIQLHPVLLFFFLAAYLTGAFTEFAVMLLIVCIHELGHVLMALYFRWRIEKIMIWIFGGVMKTAEHGSRPISEEALVVIAGPFQHVLIFACLILFGNYIPDPFLSTLHNANMMILLFNMLPVWPLDGGKLLSLVLASILPCRKAHTFTIILSVFLGLVLLSIQLIYFSFQLTSICLVLFLLMENRTEWKQRYYAFIRFLLKRPVMQIERVTETRSGHDERLLIILSKIRRNRRHIFIFKEKNNEQRVHESELLKAYFSSGSHDKTIGQILARRN